MYFPHAQLALALGGGLLYGVGTTDPFTFMAVPALFTLVTAVAAYLPARRAARVDPVNGVEGRIGE